MIEPTLDKWIDTGRCALIAIDMQVDFASPIGAAGQYGLVTPDIEAASEKTNQLLAAARKSELPIFFIGLSTTEESSQENLLQFYQSKGESIPAFCSEGSSGEQFYNCQPLPGEIIIWKKLYDAFYATNLHEKLAERQIDTLIFCGLTTECCIAATVNSAFHRNFNVIVASDACAAYDNALHLAALQIFDLSYGLVRSTHQINRSLMNKPVSDVDVIRVKPYQSPLPNVANLGIS